LIVRIRETIFRLIRRLPAVQRKITEAKEATLKSVCDEIARSVEGHEFTRKLPEKGLSQVENHIKPSLFLLVFCFVQGRTFTKIRKLSKF